MTKLRPELYVGREQTYAKHYVVKHYLEKLAYKVGASGATMNFIDGFAGPWQNKDETFNDTSPHIAVRVLRDARAGLRKRYGAELRVRAMFIERDNEKFDALASSFANVSDIEVLVRPGEFEANIAEAVTFGESGKRPFCFALIDPCGWKGFGLNAITPLLRIERCEVLINFMTNFVNEFIDDPRPQTAATFEDLFGSTDFRDRWAGLQGPARQAAIVATYCARVRERGGFAHVASAEVFNPLNDRVHYHLVYATRHDEGLRTFRAIERAALQEQEAMRAGAQGRRRQASAPGQVELFGAEALATPYIASLRSHYHGLARQEVMQFLASRRSVPFDELAVVGMQHPMTAEQDVRDFLKADAARHTLAFDGLTGKERTPQWRRGHGVRMV